MAMESDSELSTEQLHGDRGEIKELASVGRALHQDVDEETNRGTRKSFVRIEDSESGSGVLPKRAPSRNNEVKMSSSSPPANQPASSAPGEASPKPDDGDGQASKEIIDDSSNSISGKTTLRKGKWAVEEEEYTSRVIQHFSAGLLTLPDGATLRSYLAEKLNCDPMRITKKFTGACCLGRRVYHLRDRPRATPAELELAKVERDHLEQRFWLRIEHEQSGVPMTRNRDLILAHPPTNIAGIFQAQSSASSGNTLSPWLQSFMASPALGHGAASMSSNVQGSRRFLSNPSNHLQHQQLLSLQQQNQQQKQSKPWFLAGSNDRLAGTPGSHPDPSLQLLNSLVASWAVVQAAVSLPQPSLASLASNPAQKLPSNTQPQQQVSATAAAPVAESVPIPKAPLDLQAQLRQAYEEQMKEEGKRQLLAAFEEERRRKTEQPLGKAPAPDAPPSSSVKNVAKKHAVVPAPPAVSPAELLQRSYEAHLKSLQSQSEADPKNALGGSRVATSSSGRSVTSSYSAAHEQAKREDNAEKPMDDEEAGTVLLGFLNSLRQSYEDAVESKSGSTQAERQGQDSKADAHRNTSEKDSQPKVTHKIPVLGVASNHDEKHNGRHKKNGARKEALESGSQTTRLKFDEGENLSTAVSRFISLNVGRKRPASVTDVSSGNSSSQPAEFSSSLEDSSDKTDPSSSEEEKEAPKQRSWSNKGPPRKRLKARSLTKTDLRAHSQRMGERVDDD